MESVFQAAPVGLCFVDRAFRYTIVNECFATMYDQARAHFIGRTVREALPAVADQIMAHLESCLAAETTVAVEISVSRNRPADRLSSTLIYLRTAQPMRDAQGAIVGFSISLVDITERKRAEAALRESEENYRYAVELNPHIPFVTDETGQEIYVSPRRAILTGLLVNEIDRGNWLDGVHWEDRQTTEQKWLNSLDTGIPYDHTYRLHCAEGQWRWVRARAFPRRDEAGCIVRWYGTLEDIHERTLIGEALRNKTIRLEEVSAQLSQRVREDHLTGLANRRHFDDALQSETRRARRSRQPLSLIMLDVDHFKLYNDTFGHPAGDKCLREVASALQSSLRRQGDLAARYGGEEFVILLPDTSEEGALSVAEYANQAIGALAIRHPAGETGFLTVSAGIYSMTSETDICHQNAAANLLEGADLALYSAKMAGRNRVISVQQLNSLCSTAAAT